MTKVQALITDLGGIYMEISFDLAIEYWAQKSGKSAEEMKAVFHFDQPFSDFEVNKITEASYLHHLDQLLGLGIPHEDIHFKE